MSKILISDLFGTLIPTEFDIKDWYGDSKDMDHRDKKVQKLLFDRTFLHLKRQLNKFLQDGNYLKIVTGIDNHESADFVFENYITRIYENLSEYKDQIQIFLAGGENALKSLSKVSTINYGEDGISISNDYGISTIFVRDKTEVYDFILKQYNPVTDRLYSIGDSEIDVRMLIKCIELGGKSSFIYNDLYWFDEPLGSVILTECTTKELDYNGENNLYNLIRDGKIDIEDLRKKQKIYEILKEYNTCYCIYDRSKKIDIEKYKDNFTMYPTFTDYYSKVLKF